MSTPAPIARRAMGTMSHFSDYATYRVRYGCVKVAYAHGEHIRFLLQTCSFLLLAFMVASCESHRSGGRPHDATMKTYEQWRESVSFPYTAPQIRKERIVKNIEKIRVGSTKGEVVKAFGEPGLPYGQETLKEDAENENRPSDVSTTNDKIGEFNPSNTFTLMLLETPDTDDADA